MAFVPGVVYTTPQGEKLLRDLVARITEEHGRIIKTRLLEYAIEGLVKAWENPEQRDEILEKVRYRATARGGNTPSKLDTTRAAIAAAPEGTSFRQLREITGLSDLTVRKHVALLEKEGAARVDWTQGYQKKIYPVQTATTARVLRTIDLLMPRHDDEWVPMAAIREAYSTDQRDVVSEAVKMLIAQKMVQVRMVPGEGGRQRVTHLKALTRRDVA